jgi:uncharacterized protein (TIGR03086 family)
MTTSTTLSAPPVPADPRPRFLTAARTARDLIATTLPECLSGPTPCTDYDVRSLMSHLVAVLRRITAVAQGVPLSATPREVTGVPDDGWDEAATRALEDLEAVWSDDAVLDRRLELPFGTMPGRVALVAYTAEVTTHTWDLGVATGRTVPWDDDVVGAALAAVREVLPPGIRLPAIPFADEVHVPDDAPLIDRLVGWQGRDPGWRAEG